MAYNEAYQSRVEALRQLDFLVEMNDALLYKEFAIKGTTILIRVHSNRYLFSFDYNMGGGVHYLDDCFDRLPKSAQEMLVWHLDLFK